MKIDEETEGSKNPAATAAHKPYNKPQITEWGSIVELTGNFLNGAVDPMFGVSGTVPGLRPPPPPR